MNINGEYRIPASRERVWEALRDPEMLRACIPGCEDLHLTADGSYEGRLTTQVGAVTSVFAGRARLEDEDYPRAWVVSAQTRSQSAGFADGQATVTLTAEGEAVTVIGYRAKLEPGGRLASVGNRLLHGVAIRMANEFFVRLIDRLKPRKPGSAPQDLAGPVVTTLPPRMVVPVAPTQADAGAADTLPGDMVPPGQPPPDSEAVPGLAYQGEEDPRTQRRIIVAGWVAYAVIIVMIFGPKL